jgi:isoamylase
MQDEHWADGLMHCFGMVLDGRAQATGIRRRGEDASLLLVFNAHDDVVEFTLPKPAGGGEWRLLVDTNLADDAEKGVFRPGGRYKVTGRSFLLFVLAQQGERESKKPGE